MQGMRTIILTGLMICSGASISDTDASANCLTCEQEAYALALAESTLEAAQETYDDAYDDFLANPSVQNGYALAQAEALLDAAQQAYDETYDDWLDCVGPGGDPNEPPLVSILER